MNKKRKLHILALLVVYCSLLIVSCENPFIIEIVEPKTVAFESNGGSRVESQTVFKNQPVRRPADPSKSDHTFIAWFSDNGTFLDEWDFDAIPADDMTLYAKWNIIEMIIITDAAITVTRPVTDAVPDTAASGTGNFTIGAVTWNPDDNPFKAGEVYTASVTLTANQNYTFTGLTGATINGNDAEIIDNTGNTLTLSYTFPQTRTVTGIAIKTQPKLTYTHGETLDLSALVVTITYDEGADDIVVFGDFASRGITASPAHGTVLSRSEHDGQTVTITYGSLAPLTTAALTVNAAPINAAAVNITAPVKGGTPSSTATADASVNFDIETVSWTPADDPFKPDVVYTATVTLTAKQNYDFAPTAAATVNGNAATVSGSGASVTLTYIFAATNAKDVTALAIKTQPSNLNYTHGETLNLTGLVVTLTYDDTTTEDVALAAFGSKNITTVPANGAALSYSTHNAPVAVKHGTMTENTSNLTVSRKALTVATASHTKTYDGATSASGVTVTLSGILNGDLVSAGTVTAVYTAAAVGTTTINISAVTLTGAASGNYTVTVPANGITVTGITKATPAALTPPTASAITYPAALSASTLSGGSTGGTWAWQTPATVPDVTNSGYTAVFTPTDTANYDWSGVTLTQSVSITVSPASISAAALTVTAPAIGGTPSTISTGTGNFSRGSVTWTPNPATFTTGVEYTAAITLTANTNYTFTGLTTATINGNAAQVSGNTGAMVTLSYEFDALTEGIFGTTQINAIAYGNSKWVAVGNSGKMAYTTDGTNWTLVQDSIFISDIYDISNIFSIAYVNNRFVAGGEGARIAYSDDGVTWSGIQISPFIEVIDEYRYNSSPIRGIAYGNNKFVAVGNDGRMAYSSNLTDWTAVADSAIWDYQSGVNTNKVIIYGITYANGKFVAVGARGKMATSTDGINWTAVEDSTFSTVTIFGITYGNNKFVAVGSTGHMATSTDGTTWQAVIQANNTFGTINIQSITYDNNKFVAVGNNGRMAYSTDGGSWTAVTAESSTFGNTYIYGIAYGNNNRWVAGGQGGKMAYSTDNGITWTAVP